MSELSAADVSRVYNELADVTSSMTAEVVMYSVFATQRDNLLTKDYLDAQLAAFAEKFERRFTDIDRRFSGNDAKFVSIDRRFADIDRRFVSIDRRFASLEAKMEIGFERADAKLERAMRQQVIWLSAAMFTFNTLLATWLTLAT